MERDAMTALAELLEPALRDVTARKYGRGYKHDASGTPATGVYSHGPGGNLSFPGVDPFVFHTVIGNKGIIGQLPALPSRDTNPTYEVITGVKADTGSEKDAVCDDAPTAGLMKTGLLTSVFGRYERATPEMEINRLGQHNDRADPMDLTLIGSPINAGGVFASGARNPATPADVLRNEISRKMWELDVSIHRLLSGQIWTGHPTNNSAGKGYKELTGFDVLINTGMVHAEDNTALPSLDSKLIDFGSLAVQDNGPALVDAFAWMYAYLQDVAERTGVAPVRWVIAMPQTLFWEITAVWPCSYLVARCQVTGNQRVTIDGNDQVRFRDEMRAGKYLLINGDRVEVILDDGIDVTDGNEGATPAGCFLSDVYFIPMSIVGGRAVTYLEYFDYGNPDIAAALAPGLVNMRVEGPFLIWPRQKNTCFVFQTKIEPRLVLRTPWLAGRIQNVKYCPTLNFRDPFPAGAYFVDGGKVSRSGPSYYTPWGVGTGLG